MPRLFLGLICYLVLCLPLGGQSLAVSYALQTIAGSDNAGDGGPAAAAALKQIEGLATDGRGNIYIADAADHRVRKITPAGIISTLAGTGHAGFSGDGGPASLAQLRTPYGLTVDRNGNIYIADLGNARLRRVSPEGMISTFAGGGPLDPAQGEGLPATSIALNTPRNVGTDFYGTLYFSDFAGNRVFQVSAAGTLNLVAGTGVAGLSGDGTAAVRAQLSAPAGLAVDSAGALYISDSGNGRIRKVFRGVITTLGDSGIPGTKSFVAVTVPTGLALDPDGSLFIADAGGNQILRVTPAGAATPIAQPARDIAVDAQGNLYASSGATVARRPRLGAFSPFAGGTIAGFLGDNGPLLRATFSQPGAVARDAAGNLYIADTGHHRIRKIATDGSIVTIAGNGAKGFAGDGGLAVSAQLDSPVGVAIDTSGVLYIGDTGNQRIRRVDSTGAINTIAGDGTRGRSPDGTSAIRAHLDTPTWLAVDRDGAVYVSETGGHSVRVILPKGELTTVAGTGTRGYTGDGGPAISASLDSPQGLAIDTEGDLYIADAGNGRIRYVPAPSAYGPSLIMTVPSNSAASWRAARGLAIDAQGSVFVADAGDSRVFRIDPPGRVLTISGTGKQGFSGEGGPALTQALDTPTGIALDPSGTVYLVDSGNGRIRGLTPAFDPAAPVTAPPVQPSIAVLNAASLQPGDISPGELVSIFGSGLGPPTPLSAQQATVELGGTQVLLNGRLAPLFYVSQNQINLQVPYSLGDARPCEVQVVAGGVVKARAAVTIAESAPAIFSVSGGTGQAAALNEDGSFNSPENPADRGSIVVLFATGEGQTIPSGIEGRPAGFPIPSPVLPVSVKIGTYASDILYAGSAPGFSGLLQINARIPGGFAPPGTLPVTLQIGTATSPAGVTITVR